MNVRLTKPEAQALAVIASRLDRRPARRGTTRDDLLETVRHLGTVQLDTISVISRSHETVLWSRLGQYDTALIEDLYERDHALTEYLGHAASILPTDTLHLFRPSMERAQASDTAWLNQPENRAAVDAVLQRITAEGPMTSRHFEAPPDAGRAGEWEWWGTKPERRILGHLWGHGRLMIHKRDRGFARHFDLPDRVCPGFWDGSAIDIEDARRELLSHAVRALGITTAPWATDYFRTGGSAHVSNRDTRRLLDEFAAGGRVIRVEVPGIDEPVWMDAELQERLELLRERKGWPTLTTFLSPFDNLTWKRSRSQQLWDFDYRLEIYVPAPKRLYGYYSMPILYRGALIGRLDPSYDRKSKYLTVKALHLEPGVRPTEPMVRAIAKALDDLVRFLGGQPGDWDVLTSSPPELLRMLYP